MAKAALAMAALLLGTAAGAVPPVATFDWFHYEGADPLPEGAELRPGDYRNPVLAGFYPDPSITRVGEDYYLVTSTFGYFPGLPVFRSRDLVNWTQIGNAIDRPDQLDFTGLGLSRGVFAPAIEAHDGIFYIANTCVDCGGNFLIMATDPAGPWSDPVWLPDLEGGIDPSLFFDEDGRAWILNNGPPPGEPLYEGHRAIWIQEYDVAVKRTIGPRTLLVNGGVDISQKPIWIEGPHIYKVGGLYYLTAAEGGTAEGHSQVVLRSANVTGPYEPYSGNPILTQRDLPRDRPLPITSAGHADLVRTPLGEWWATFLAVRPYEGDLYNTGREVFLMPVRWENGWPRITGPGETIPYVHPRPNLPRGEAAVPTTGPFSLREEFDAPRLPFHWMMVRNPGEVWHRTGGGRLELDARPVRLGDMGNPSFLARRQQHLNAAAETIVRFDPARDGDLAGLAAFQSDDYWYLIAVGQEGGRRVVTLRRRADPSDPVGGVPIAAAPVADGVPVRLRIAARGADYDFLYGADDGEWRELATGLDGRILSTRVAGGFVGAVFGLHAYSSASPAGETAVGIRLNQVGFLPGPAKRAVVPHRSTVPLPWRLTDAGGATIAEGHTEVIGPDGYSGEHVHLVDFGAFTGTGDGFRLVVDGARSRPFAVRPDLYDGLPRDALAYFYHNRSGIPIEARFVGERWARPAGHPVERVTCFAGEDQNGNIWPSCGHVLDVSRGWYDAGDHGKYVVNGGISLWTLLNAYERRQHHNRPELFPDGSAAIPEAGNGVNDLLDEARWQLDFMLAMQVPEGTRMRLPVGIRQGGSNLPFTEIDVSGMAHHKIADEKWTGLPLAPHEDQQPRFLYPPSTAATLNLAATAAQCARVWRGIDDAFAARCLAAAERAFAAARRNPEIFAIGNFDGSGGYGDPELSDEFHWAAAELFVTTGNAGYEAVLRASPHFSAAVAPEPGWPGTATLGTISLALVPNRLAAGDLQAVRVRLTAAADAWIAERERVGYRIPYAPEGYPWGSNSSVLNRAMILALVHDFTGAPRYRDAVVDSMDYILGRNPLDVSYVSGWGARPMRHPHHRFWAHSLDPAYPPPPPGALSGGPNNTNMSDDIARTMRGTCHPQTCWVDHIDAFSMNEVAINWNAPLLWVAAWLTERD
ncbi:MAG: family 43 glycosylhydrolase [Allosphingosinicella sp.]|uniref:family 43 glycosylhydrolase n=1 Tax=Allosphingosinicella sp. TaxID=2823234 RepID=UPI00395E9F01